MWSGSTSDKCPCTGKHLARSGTSSSFSRHRSSRTGTLIRDKRVEFQTLYQELINDPARIRRIWEAVVDSVRNGRSPLNPGGAK